MTEHDTDPAPRLLATGKRTTARRTGDVTLDPRQAPVPRPDLSSATAALDDLATSILRVARALRWTTERDLKDDLAELFAREGYNAERERAIGPAERPDFLLQDGIGVEVKVKGTADQLERQVRRYLAHADIN